MARESKASKQRRGKQVVAALAKAYPKSTCALRHRGSFQLLVATMLSAQTTDIAVNLVTGELFRRWPNAKKMAAADPEDVGAVINSIGLWRGKAKNAVAASKIIMDRHGGRLPRSIDELVQLPGVGYKTATAVLGTAFDMPVGVTVDTHMLRINRHLRLSTSDNPDKMAAHLEAILPANAWNVYTHRIIDHGRLVCVARRPRCGVCPLAELCPSALDPSIGYKATNDERVPASAKGLSWRVRRSNG